MSRWARVRRARRRAGDPSFDPPAPRGWYFDWPAGGLSFGRWETIKFIETAPVEPMPADACVCPDPDEWDRPEAWDGWRAGRSVGDNPLMYHETKRRLRAHISWGPTCDHVQPGDWGPAALWYVDLEVQDSANEASDLAAMLGWSHGERTAEIRADRRSGLVGHLERGFPTWGLAVSAVEWLRSCIEVAGDEGLLALNARSGGRHA